ncbi:MAG TPA: hypothetical protein PKV73_08030 [Agriterribacter sp.]|nr:hypothetical protein [Agriterribacter sp.]
MIKALLIFISVLLLISPASTQWQPGRIHIPDSLIMEGYNVAAKNNVLASINPKVFFGYFSVCADGLGYGYGNTYPSLDGHQMSDALLWLGQTDIVKANWSYVKSFQKPTGELPIAILPAEAGKEVGLVGYLSRVDSNGGLYRHWVPGDPLRVLGPTTYIQNADIIFRFTQDMEWLKEQIFSINLCADYLSSLVSAEGLVGGAGYYVERPTRIEYDGVSQCFATDAFFRVAALNRRIGEKKEARKYEKLAEKIRRNFQNGFWISDHFAEYIHPDSGIISRHGYTDSDWTALATGMANRKQKFLLWQQLEKEKRFYYGGMPTGIATNPEKYENWEFSYPDRQELAAMGRVWYTEAWARASMDDATGLIETLHLVCKKGKENGWYWRERYNSEGGYGADKYNEYPANLIRIVQRFLLGLDIRVDGTVTIFPKVPEAYWEKGFGQTLAWNDNALSYEMKKDYIIGTYTGSSTQHLCVQLCTPDSWTKRKRARITINGIPSRGTVRKGKLHLILPAASEDKPCYFQAEKINNENKP